MHRVKAKPRPTDRPGLRCCSGVGIPPVGPSHRTTTRLGLPWLVQWDRVEHTPRGMCARPIDALGPGDAGYVGIVDGEVQGRAVVGHLTGAVRPHDDSERTLIDARPGVGPPGS